MFRDVEFWLGVTRLALAHPDARQEDLARSRALYVVATMCSATGRYGEAFALAQSSASIARACGDALALAEALCRLAYAAMALDRAADAREYLIEGLALARQTGDRRLLAAMPTMLGELYSQQDQFELAEAAYLEALAGFRGSPVDEVVVLCNLARNSIALRAEAKAIQYLREAAAIADGRYATPIAAPMLWNCAGLAALRGEWKQALRWGGAAASHQQNARPS